MPFTKDELDEIDRQIADVGLNSLVRGPDGDEHRFIPLDERIKLREFVKNNQVPRGRRRNPLGRTYRFVGKTDY